MTSSPSTQIANTPQNPLSAFIVKLVTNFVHYFPLIDGVLFMFEFYFIIAIVGIGISMISPVNIDKLDVHEAVAKCTLPPFLCLLKVHCIPIAQSLVKHFLWIFCVTRWFLWRHSVRFQRRLRWELSRTGYAIIMACLIGFAWMLATQYLTGIWIYSTRNWTEHTYDRVILFLFGSPLLEELLMRVILTMVFRRRTGDSVLWTVLYTNFCFSAMHVWNRLSHASDVFTFLQCIIAFVIGCFYSTRYFVTGNVFEVIVLHFANNLSGMFVPVDLSWEDVYPYFIVPILMTLGAYLFFLWKDSRYIVKGESEIKPRWVKEQKRQEKREKKE
mmetsp:Transcript_10677/g.39889  ORF Transcript_10677/g.39889 Transcript_10677/m.39889 type:complete len:329 (+) Transcript_10677:1-987(+)